MTLFLVCLGVYLTLGTFMGGVYKGEHPYASDADIILVTFGWPIWILLTFGKHSSPRYREEQERLEARRAEEHERSKLKRQLQDLDLCDKVIDRYDQDYLSVEHVASAMWIDLEPIEGHPLQLKRGSDGIITLTPYHVEEINYCIDRGLPYRVITPQLELKQ